MRHRSSTMAALLPMTVRYWPRSVHVNSVLLYPGKLLTDGWQAGFSKPAR